MSKKTNKKTDKNTDKKTVQWVCFGGVVLCVVLLGYLAYILTFPLAEPFEKPAMSNMYSARVTGTDLFCDINQGEAIEFFNQIGEVKPTRRQSVNDSPYNDTYCCLEIVDGGTTYKYYVYIIDDTAFLEQPYVGVYEIEMKDYKYLEELLP